MVVRMSCWALETCLTYVPRQRRRCSREKVDHHQPARFLVGACRRRPPGDPSHSSARPHFEKRFSQRPRAWPAPGLYGARSERTEPPPPSDGSARDLRQNVEFSQIRGHVILRHVGKGGDRGRIARAALACAYGRARHAWARTSTGGYHAHSARPKSVRNRPTSAGHRATSSMPSESRAWPPLCTCRIGVRRARHAWARGSTGGYHAHSATSKRQESAYVSRPSRHLVHTIREPRMAAALHVPHRRA